jgi:hypothetical protein
MGLIVSADIGGGIILDDLYLRIAFVIDNNGDSINIDYAIFKDWAACDHGNGSKIGNYIRIHSDQKLDISNCTSNIEAAYKYLKTLPQFVTAIDA